MSVLYGLRLLWFCLRVIKYALLFVYIDAYQSIFYKVIIKLLKCFVSICVKFGFFIMHYIPEECDLYQNTV